MCYASICFIESKTILSFIEPLSVLPHGSKITHIWSETYSRVNWSLGGSLDNHGAPTEFWLAQNELSRLGQLQW
jgi:hypothetical protein